MMMLTAFDANSRTILDVTAVNEQTAHEIHGKKTARRHGYELVCRQCGRGVHVVRNHLHRLFVRHDPSDQRGCAWFELGRTTSAETVEHLEGKLHVIQAIRSLPHWTAEPERHVHNEHGEIRIDVAAEYRGRVAHEHQHDSAWEVQMSPQPTGAYLERASERLTIAGLTTNWLTPHAERIGDQQAMICDTKATLIVARMNISYEPEIAAPPTPIETVIRSVCRTRRTSWWHQFGEHGEWYVTSIDAWPNDRPPPRRRDRARRLIDDDIIDRECDRIPIQPIPRPSGSSSVDRTRVERRARPELWTHVCRVCGSPIPFPYGGRLDGPQCVDCWEGGGREHARRRGRGR